MALWGVRLREVEDYCTLRILLHPRKFLVHILLCCEFTYVHILHSRHESQRPKRSKNTSCDASGWFLDPPESTKNHMPSECIMGGFGHFIKFAKLEETLNPRFPHWLQIVEHWNMRYRTFRDDNLRSPSLGKPIWERANMGGIINAMRGQATATTV